MRRSPYGLLRIGVALALGLACTAVATSASAWPNGPDEDPRLDPPNDPGFGGQWNLWSFVPEEWTTFPGFRTEEIEMGTGIHADRAWQRTTGDRRVIIAVLDSGVYWDNRDLVNKYYLNAGELGNCLPKALDTPPAGATPTDVDGSGWFDVRDYFAAAGSEAAILEEWDANGNGMMDPQDLILKCSDGVDSDGNGYVDDISGWDFFHDDNDAYDETRFGHGNGEARDSAAEGNNGMGDIGVCPECTLLMVRAGDSFVTDANDYANGVIFSVDSGASVIQCALGTVNNTSFSQLANDYAYANNTVVIASAADELSYHHNYPGTNNHTVYVHAIMYDGASADQSTTFLNFNNCTNFGMQLLLSTSGTGCSSEATGITAGHAGLMYGMALQAGLDPPISAEEIKQILTLTADDINVNPLDNDPTKFPSAEGFDWHFGYGRNNARTSVDWIHEGRIPPEVDIITPRWFEVVYPDKTPKIEISGRINHRMDGRAPRYDSVDWVLEYALGVAPNDGFIEIAKGTVDSAGLDGVIAEWDTTKVQVDLDARRTDPHQNAITLRLTATGTLPNGLTVSGEHRKGVLLDRDPDLLPGFPILLGASGESSPVFADIDGNGTDEELVVCTADGHVHVYKSDGSQAPGFPVKLQNRRALREDNPTNVRNSCAFRDDKAGCIRDQMTLPNDVSQTVMMAPAVGDLDADGRLEIIINTWDGYVFVFNSDGQLRDGWPKTVDWSKSANTDKKHVVDGAFMAAPILYDMDNDGDLEVISAAQDQHIYGWHDDGSAMDNYPIRVGDVPAEENSERIVCTPAIGDVDGDGTPEIATGTNEAIGASDAKNEAKTYLIDGLTGEIEPGWPQPVYGLIVDVLPIVGKGVPTNPIMADLDYDGDLEISFDTISTQGWMFHHDGTIFAKMNNRDFGPLTDSADSPAYILMNNGAMGYIDPDGGLDFVKGTAGFDFAIAFAGGGTRGYFDHQLSGWDTDTTSMLEGFPRVMDDWQFFNTPTIVDINNDTDPEVLIGSGGYFVHAFNYKGEEPEGWPKQTGGWIIASVAVGDFDGDQLFEVAVTTRSGWLFAWETPGKVQSLFEWNGYGGSPHNTNNYELGATPYKIWTGEVEPPKPEPDPDPPAVGGDEGPEPQPEPAPEGTDEPAPTPGDTDEGGCTSGSSGLPLGWLAALLALALVGRRRRGALSP